MSNVVVLVKVPLKAGTRDAALEAVKGAIANTMAEDGTLQYIALEDPNDENIIYMWEVYTGQEALMAHGGAEWFKAFSASLAAYVGGKVEFTFLSPLMGKGL